MFVYLQADKKGLIKKGFYRQITVGKVALYQRSNKKIEEKVEGTELIRRFISKEEFFIKRNDSYTRIKKSQDMMDVLKDKSRELNQYKKKFKLRFKKNAARFITDITQYYNQL